MGVRVVFAGGGTGGHIIPAIAVANEIARRGGTVRFVGSADRLEAQLVPKAGYGIEFIRVRPLVGMGRLGMVRGLLSVPSALVHAGGLLKKLSPDAVLGVGGYVAGPVVLAAKLRGVPSAILEQNATVGLTNRILSKFIDLAFVSYEHTAHRFRSGKVAFTGNPVDQSIIDASSDRPNDLTQPVRIVVMGGSQGAEVIDERVPLAIERAGVQKEVSLLHQCSPTNRDELSYAYKKMGVDAQVVSFIHNMAKAYSRADLVIARSGATTVAELTAVGLPAVLLPYPHHSDRQQVRNSNEMAQHGAAVVLDQNQTGVAEMADAVLGFVRDPNRRRDAARASKSLGRPGAAAAVADGLEQLVRGRE